jgi:hypothetical protein
MKTNAISLYPFVPSGPSFPTALAFFNAIGFVTQWQGGGCAGMRFGEAYFLLQDYDSIEWAQNQMVVIAVDDLDGYWSELEALDLPAAFPGVRLKPPTDFPWGREVHVIDPAGVCWHVRQAGT